MEDRIIQELTRSGRPAYFLLNAIAGAMGDVLVRLYWSSRCLGPDHVKGEVHALQPEVRTPLQPYCLNALTAPMRGS